MSRFIYLVLFLAPTLSFSQNKLGKSKPDAKKELEIWVSGNVSFRPVVSESDSTIKLHISDPKTGEVDFIYFFDKDGICIIEKTVTTCEDCRKPYLNSALEQKGYGWKKINGNQYISKFSDQAMIEIPADEKDHSFSIYRATWSKEVYDLLIKN